MLLFGKIVEGIFISFFAKSLRQKGGFDREKFNFMRNKGFFSGVGTFFMNYIAKGR